MRLIPHELAAVNLVWTFATNLVMKVAIASGIDQGEQDDSFTRHHNGGNLRNRCAGPADGVARTEWVDSFDRVSEFCTRDARTGRINISPIPSILRHLRRV